MRPSSTDRRINVQGLVQGCYVIRVLTTGNEDISDRLIKL